MRVSTYTIVKNEAEFIGYGIMSVLDYVDEMVFADGNSKDGTIEIIKYIKKKYDKDNKIKLFENKDCKNLKDDYVRLFNWTLKQCTGDYVWFLHPDMICVNPKEIKKITDKYIRYSVKMKSFAGENRDMVITKGRTNRWYTIMKNDYGIHYYGNYGEKQEDMYFRDITGDNHTAIEDCRFLPYEIKDLNLELYHYCDTKPYERRLGRMRNVIDIVCHNMSEEWRDNYCKTHPRVTLENGSGFEFKKFSGKQPEVFRRYKDEFRGIKAGR